MPGRCFVPGCKSGTDSARKRDRRQNIKHPQIFSAPKNWTMLQIWKHVIPGSKTEFSITDKVCELHFTKDYVIKFHELPNKDGKVLKMERTYARLKPGAIPTVFKRFPRYSENVQQIVNQMHKEFPLHVPQMDVKLNEQMENYLKIISELRGMSTLHDETACEAEKSDSNSEAALYETEGGDSNKNTIANTSASNETTFSDDELDTEDRNESDVGVDIDDNKDVNTGNINSDFADIEVEEEGENKPDDITFDELVKNVKSVSKPNSSWSVTCHGKFVMCAKWNKEYQPEKRVVIDHDLNIKVFLNDQEIAAYNNCISDISDVSNVLRILDK